jgi:hypothetical protein
MAFRFGCPQDGYLEIEAIMGRASRGKQNRTPAPYTRPPFSSYLPDGPTWLFVIGVGLLSYGTAVAQYSRWNPHPGPER